MKSRNYLEVRKDRLKDPREAAAYLEAALNYENEEGFMLALRTVAEVYGITNVARDTGLGRESLYKTLHKDGNPKLRTLKTVLDTLGIRIAFESNEESSSMAQAVEARESGARPYGKKRRSTTGRATATAAARRKAVMRDGGQAPPIEEKRGRVRGDGR